MPHSTHLCLDTAKHSLGFGQSLEEDLWAIRYFSEKMEIVVATSYSKNFTIYGERVGSVHFTVPSPGTRAKLLSQLSYYSRAEVSTPPIFGASIISTILSSPELKNQWLSELDFCCNRVRKMRTTLYNAMKTLGTPGDWSFLLNQSGMFSYTGFSAEEVSRLKDVWHVHLLDTGRVNIAGRMTPPALGVLIEVNPENVEYVAQAFDDIVRT